MLVGSVCTGTLACFHSMPSASPVQLIGQLQVYLLNLFDQLPKFGCVRLAFVMEVAHYIRLIL